jgi:hypothetical protein
MTPVTSLQTTQSVEPIDTVGLVLLVVFVISVVLLAILLLRPWWTMPPSGIERNDDVEEPDPWPTDERRSEFPEPRPRHPAVQPQRPEPSWSSPSSIPEEASLPVWLENSLPPPTSVSAFAAIAEVVTTLVEASNRGDLRAGFALYSPRYREEFLRETGVDESRFEEWMSSAGNRPAQPISVSAIREVTSRPDSSVEAAVTYRLSSGAMRDERITFVQTPRGKWLIDNITYRSPETETSGLQNWRPLVDS